jgi:hypothetical protein
MNTTRLFPTLFCGAALAMAAFSPGATAQPSPGSLLGTTGNSTNELVVIDPATGASSFLADIGNNGPVTEIEFRADSTLFGATGQGTSNIITIDPATGTETVVGQHAPGAVNALEFIGGTLYGAFLDVGGANGPQGGGPGGGNYFLVTVNQNDGSLTQIGALTNYGPVRGLAYDPSSGTLYGAATPQVVPFGQIGPVSDVLFTINPSTGATNEIGSLGASIGAIEFGPDGTLYGGQAGGGGITNEEADRGLQATLFTIDTATGAASPVGATDVPAISGLSFAPAGAPQPVSVPAIGPASLSVLIAMLALLGVFFVRRMV